MSKYAETIEEYKEFIQIIVNRVLKEIRLHGTISVEDLVHEGVTGLIEASRRYDPSRGVKFTTFAAFRVRGAIIDAIRRMQPYDRRSYAKMREARRLSRVEDGRLDPLSANDGGARLNELIGMLAPELIAAELADPDELRALYCPEENYLDEELKRELARVVAELPSRERLLVRDVYLRERSLADAAAELGLSASWASRLLQRALDRLRNELEADDPKASKPDPR